MEVVAPYQSGPLNRNHQEAVNKFLLVSLFLHPMAGRFAIFVPAVQQLPLSEFLILSGLSGHSPFQGKMPNTRMLVLVVISHCPCLLAASVLIRASGYVASMCRLMLEGLC